jgi:hypothetical protein
MTWRSDVEIARHDGASGAWNLFAAKASAERGSSIEQETPPRHQTSKIYYLGGDAGLLWRIIWPSTLDFRSVPKRIASIAPMCFTSSLGLERFPPRTSKRPKRPPPSAMDVSACG